MRMLIKPSTALLAALTLSLASGAAAAVQPAPGELVVESARFSGEQDVVAVPYADLRLGTAAGQRNLLQRVGFAIETLCGRTNLADPTYSLKCSNQARSEVEPQLARLLTR